MKKLLGIVVLCLIFFSKTYADHQTDHQINLICNYSDGSGNIEIKFDKNNFKEYRPLFVKKIRDYKIIKINNSEVVAYWQKDDTNRIFYYISRTSGNFILAEQVVDPSDNKYKTWQETTGQCKSKAQAF